MEGTVAAGVVGAFVDADAGRTAAAEAAAPASGALVVGMVGKAVAVPYQHS